MRAIRSGSRASCVLTANQIAPGVKPRTPPLEVCCSAVHHSAIAGYRYSVFRQVEKREVLLLVDLSVRTF